jgi:imidazolonepropionase
MSILPKYLKGLVQVRDNPITMLRGADMKLLPVLEDAYLLIEDGKVKAYGPMSNVLTGQERS